MSPIADVIAAPPTAARQAMTAEGASGFATALVAADVATSACGGTATRPAAIAAAALAPSATTAEPAPGGGQRHEAEGADPADLRRGLLTGVLLHLALSPAAAGTPPAPLPDPAPGPAGGGDPSEPGLPSEPSGGLRAPHPSAAGAPVPADAWPQAVPAASAQAPTGSAKPGAAAAVPSRGGGHDAAPEAAEAVSHPAPVLLRPLGEGAPRADASSPDLASAASPGGAGREPATAAGAVERGGGRVEPAGARMRADATPTHSPAAPDAAAGTLPGPAAPPGDGASAAPAPLAERLLEAIEDLQHRPPPKRMVIEVGDLRLTVALRGDEVRLTVAGERGEQALPPEWDRELVDALAGRGFSLGGGDRQGGRDGAPSGDRRETLAPGRAGSRPRPRSTASAVWRL